MEDLKLALGRARLTAMRRLPYFSRALLALRPCPRPGLGTVAVDPHWRLYIDPDVVDAWTHEELAGALIHEVSHLLRHHHDRARANGVAPNDLSWNLAADCEINDDLLRAGVTLVNGVATPEAFGLPADLTAERYYTALSGEPARQLGSADCGSGADGHRRTWDGGDDPGVSEAGATAIRRDVAKAITARSRSEVPGGLLRWAESVIRPQVPWQRVLAAHVRRGVLRAGAGDAHRWDRPSRRQPAGPKVLLPSLAAHRPNLAVVLDTSGSIDQTTLDQALAEIDAIVGSLGGAIDLVACDASAHVRRVVTSARRSGVVGGGGTDMSAGIEAASRLNPRPQVIVVITDGQTGWPDPAPRGTDVLCVLTGDAPAPRWATAIRLSPP